jgi:hypothetical protein
MLLLLAVLAGVIAGTVRARIGKRPYQIIQFRSIWIVILALLPQIIAFYLPSTRRTIPTDLAKIFLVSSQFILLLFILHNLRLPGIWVSGLGLGLNLIVVLFNGGLMPIFPETVLQLYPEATADQIHIGERLGWSKDIVLDKEDTRLGWLGDRYLTPNFFNIRYAFSLGDVFLALGIFWTFWSFGKQTFYPT